MAFSNKEIQARFRRKQKLKKTLDKIDDLKELLKDHYSLIPISDLDTPLFIDADELALMKASMEEKDVEIEELKNNEFYMDKDLTYLRSRVNLYEAFLKNAGLHPLVTNTFNNADKETFLTCKSAWGKAQMNIHKKFQAIEFKLAEQNAEDYTGEEEEEEENNNPSTFVDDEATARENGLLTEYYERHGRS